MRSSDACRRAAAVLAFLVLAAPARAFDPERDTWLLPDDADSRQSEPRRLVDPLEYARIRADGNFMEPEYSRDMEVGLIDLSTRKNPVALKALLDVGANPNRLTGEYGSRALVEAVANGDVESVRVLLDGGADPNLAGGGFTPLGLAALRGHAEIARLLLRAGANPTLKSKDGNTPLTAAVSFNRLGVIRELLKYPQDLTLYNLEGRTALSLAAMEGFEEALTLLLEAGADPNMQDKNGNNALYWAGYADQVPMQKMLLKYGAYTQ